MNLRNGENLHKALEYFQQAIDKDPNFAAAYAGLADCYLFLTAWDHRPVAEVRASVREAIAKALELDDDSSEAHASFATYDEAFERNLNDIEHEFKRALELNPNNSDAHKVYGIVLMEAGRFEEAIGEESRALDLDPLAPHLHISAGHVFYDAQQYDRAIQEWRRAIALDPAMHFLHLNIGWAYARQGMRDEAVREWLQHWTRAPKISAILKKAYTTSGYKGYLRVQLSRDFANAFRPQRLSDYQSDYDRAGIYAELGEPDNAFRSLAKSVKQQDQDLAELRVDPDFGNLRSDARFQELVHRCQAECGTVRPF